MVHGTGNLAAANISKWMTQMMKMRMEDEDVGESMRMMQRASSSDVHGWAGPAKLPL